MSNLAISRASDVVASVSSSVSQEANSLKHLSPAAKGVQLKAGASDGSQLP